MEITVLMATYQGESYIRQQLDSILAQTVPVGLVISDDGSEDGTRKILEEYRQRYPDRIRLRHRREPGRGGEQKQTRTGRHAPVSPPAADNFFWLLSLAAQEECPYVLLSDQDDVWFPHKAETLLARMRKLEARLGQDHPVLVHSDMEVVGDKALAKAGAYPVQNRIPAQAGESSRQADSGLELISPSFFAYARCNPRRTGLAQILVENPVTGGALMMNRALLGLVWERPRICCMHDWWIALAAACFGTISCVDRPLYQYRQHGHNLVGATATGSAADLAGRLGRQKQVEENYYRMMAQAREFESRFRHRLDGKQKAVLRAFLALPGQTPFQRLAGIAGNHFYKSSPLQTLAMCVTIPFARKPFMNQKTNPPASGTPGKLDCVILNYNDAATTKALVCRLRDYRILERIVVVDNCSTDNSLEQLRRLEDRKVKVIQAERNGGYGSGNNLGVRYAVEHNQATHVLIANPDISVSESCLARLLRVFGQDSQVAVVTARLRDKQYGNLRNGWKLRGFVGELLAMGPISRRLFRRFLDYPDTWFQTKKAMYVEAVHGSMLMVDAARFLDAGGYDEHMFLYQEEAVLGQRMKALGLHSVLCLDCCYGHAHSASISRTFTGQMERQRLREESVLYYMKHYLHIRPWQEAFAKLWFWGIRVEIWGAMRVGDWLKMPGAVTKKRL